MSDEVIDVEVVDAVDERLDAAAEEMANIAMEALTGLSAEEAEKKLQSFERKTKGGWVFSCPKNGHEADATMPPMMAQLANRVFQVRICIECGCPYYIEVGRVSTLVDPAGSIITGN